MSMGLDSLALTMRVLVWISNDGVRQSQKQACLNPNAEPSER